MTLSEDIFRLRGSIEIKFNAHILTLRCKIILIGCIFVLNFTSTIFRRKLFLLHVFIFKVENWGSKCATENFVSQARGGTFLICGFRSLTKYFLSKSAFVLGKVNVFIAWTIMEALGYESDATVEITKGDLSL